ncbi:hypothetical protein [Vibrio mediterranei]|uniref:hypothetical protein n=1 Tax=Vibrio mediterranei TaxID=689 RepID=UPI00406901D3
MKVITFGSCLSRRIASMMVAEQRAELISAVMQVKSTAFIDQRSEKHPLTLVTQVHAISAVKADAPDYQVVCNNLSQQAMNVMGTFSSATEQDLISFPQAIEGLHYPDTDLMLIDTFADVLFKSFENQDGERIFANANKMDEDFLKSWKMLDKEPVKEVVSAIESLVAYVREYQPNMRIVLLHFPFGLNPSAPTRARADELKKALTNSDVLADYGVEQMSLPTPSVDDCAPKNNYHHFTGQYYRNAANLLGNASHCNDAMILGGGSFYRKYRDVLKGYDIKRLSWYEQRIDSVIERDIWRSKAPVELTMVDIGKELLSKPQSDAESLLKAGKRKTIGITSERIKKAKLIVVDVPFMLQARLSFRDVDSVGFYGVPINEEWTRESRVLSVKKGAVMLEQFAKWVRRVNPDCKLVAVIDEDLNYKSNLEDIDVRRLVAAERSFSSAGIPVLARKWLHIEDDLKRRFFTSRYY